MSLTVYDSQGRAKKSVRGPDVPLDIWHTIGNSGEPAFTNGWINYDASLFNPAGFRKMPDGTVRLRGQIKNGTLGQSPFTLPVGYRPVKNWRYSTMGSTPAAGAWAQVNVQSDGTLYANGDSNGLVGLDGIEFDTETVLALPGGPMGPIASPQRVTTLPTAPYDGQEVYYVADATNGVLWHLKYNASSASAYKWEMVGGSPLMSTALGQSITTGTGSSYATLTDGGGPDIVVPLAGEYYVEGDATSYHSTNQVNTGFGVGQVVGGVVPGLGVQGNAATLAAGNVYSVGSMHGVMPITVAGATARMVYLYNASITYYWANRRFSMIPRRVG